MFAKKLRDMYINEIPLEEITQELHDLTLMLYEDCGHNPDIKKMKSDLNIFRDVISDIQSLTCILNEKVKKTNHC